MKRDFRQQLLGLLIALAGIVGHVQASVIPVGVAAFGPGSTLTTFAGLPDFIEVNGLVVDGITFQYSLGSGQVIIDGGPGVTNNISPPNVVSIGNATGIMTMLLPSPVTALGYGFAILANGSVPSATTISLFSAAVPVGSLSYNAVPDPLFPGGFAGIQSTAAFDRVQVTFSSAAAAFAIDNIRTARNVPEPSSAALVGLGIAGLAFSRRRKQS